jgi:hypothetical protein
MELAAMLNRLPQEDRARHQLGVRLLVHDLRQTLNVVICAEALLRREIPNTPQNLELLDSIRTASRQAIGTLTDFARPFDREITRPVSDSPGE